MDQPLRTCQTVVVVVVVVAAAAVVVALACCIRRSYSVVVANSLHSLRRMVGRSWKNLRELLVVGVEHQMPMRQQLLQPWKFVVA